MALPTFDPATMVLTEVPGRREVELVVDDVRIERHYGSSASLTRAVFHDMHVDVPQDLDPAYYWAMVLSYVSRSTEAQPYSHIGGLDAYGLYYSYNDNDDEIPIRWWLNPSDWPDGVLDPRNVLVNMAEDPRRGPDPQGFHITSGGYGWGNVLLTNEPPTYELRDVPPPTIERGSYFVHYEPGLTAAYFARVVLPWRTLEPGDNQAGEFYDITDPQFEATLRTQFSRADISSNPPRVKRVRVLTEDYSLVTPYTLDIEDKRVLFIPYAGPSTVSPALGPSGAVPKVRGVSGDRRK